MTFKDYFSKTFETSDNHHIESLRTHYYRVRKEEAYDATLEVLKNMKAVIKSSDSERGEIIVDASDFTGTVSITATSYTEVAVDIIVMTFNILPSAKGKKIIEQFYYLLDKIVPLKGIALHRR